MREDILNLHIAGNILQEQSKGHSVWTAHENYRDLKVNPWKPSVHLLLPLRLILPLLPSSLLKQKAFLTVFQSSQGSGEKH